MGKVATPTWWTSLWQFCTEYEIAVQDSSATDLPVKQTSDTGLGNVWIEANLSAKIVAACTRVQQYLGVTCVTDIANMLGNDVAQQWKHNREAGDR
jgi:hypothetical protein